jgi:ribonuclease Z
MELNLLFAGTAGSAPTARRGLPATLVNIIGRRLLFDCGEGTQRQLMAADGLPNIDTVFLTHFHADHWLGLPGMLSSFALRERDTPLDVIGPPGLKALLASSRHAYGRLPYELRVREVASGEQVKFDGFSVQAVSVRHTSRAYGYVVAEDSRPGRLDAELAQRLGVSPGPAFGRLMRGETVNGVSPDQVIGQARRGRKIALSGDCSPTPAFIEAAQGADVIVHEATFTREDAARAKRTGHSTAEQAAQVAAQAGARMLAMVHVSAKCRAQDLRAEARRVFSSAFVAEDFDRVDVPLPDRGQPQHQRARSR